ncbi:1-phosphofructokinase family hexose kinase [Halonatronum saccharophilum]|uniref:1-phosphofructokinase family hexose kinase n=1 Tax=Halonatronum saccharophilum TaxID=150060 RepID=UPI00048548A0|nr:PfkB family carbohydrate kinase [Halonatronum saccharophilum]
MITTVTLNPAIDREYFVKENKPNLHQYIYDDEGVKVSPGGKGVLSAINLKNLGHEDVQNIGFVGGKQGLFFERLVQDCDITTNYIFTENEMRNNIFIIGESPATYTHYNDYTYSVSDKDINNFIKRFKRGIVDSEFIMISGAIPGGVSFDIYKELISICHENNKEVYLHASGEVLNLALEEQPKVVVPYFKHTNKILDKEVATIEDYIWAGKKLLEEGAQYAILPYECNHLIFDKDETYKVSSKDFCMVNWLGAGEAYNAAFFDYVERKGFDFIEANRWAAAAALVVAEEKEILLKNKGEIEERLELIEVERVSI